MRENRLSGSEGGATLIPSSLPLSIISPFGTTNRQSSILHCSITPRAGFEDEDDDEDENEVRGER
jgi:hypothetical protein